jgi:hypothetical protein
MKMNRLKAGLGTANFRKVVRIKYTSNDGQ